MAARTSAYASHSVTLDAQSATSLAASLVGVLIEACGDRLSDISWFKADWQRGGAATGAAKFRLDDDSTTDVVVKLPVVGRELIWMRRLQDDSVVPKLYASGHDLGGYDLAWVVVERFPYGPLGTRWHDEHMRRIADAAVRFYVAASRYPVDQAPVTEPWAEQLADAMANLKINDVSRKQQWKKAMKALRSRLDGITEGWEARNSTQWLHGDLHLANAMSREGLEAGPVALIDLGEVRAGHWIEDAVYLERQLWSRPERLKANKPVKAIAAARRKLDLPVEDDYPRLAMIRRALLAGTAPKYLKSEGDPRHLDACLDWLERALDELR